MTTLASGSSVTFGLAVDQTFEMTFADGTTGTITVTGPLGSPYRTAFGPAKKNNWRPFPLGLTGSVTLACTAGSVSYMLGSSMFVTAVTDAVTGRIDLQTSTATYGVRAVQSKIKQQYRHAGILTSSAATGGLTQCAAFVFPEKWDSVRIGYIHGGGNGDLTALIGCVAASDDCGNYDYTTDNATLRKFVTPKRGGSEYNSLTALGWSALTWSGAASVGITDPGANKIGIAWSDIVQIQSVLATDGSGGYPLLVRCYPGAAAYTNSNYSGINTATNYNASTLAKAMFCTRAGDQVTNPATFGTGNTPAYSSSTLPIIIEVFSGGSRNSVIFVGDSRFETVTETAYATTHGFAGLPYKFESYANAQGTKTRVVRSGRSGFTTTQYLALGLSVLSSATPNVAIYLGYSPNDGNATDAVLSVCRNNLLQFLDRCNTLGITAVVVPSFPDVSWNATYLANVRAFITYCQSLGCITFDALTKYGDASGIYLTAYNDGTLGSHMNQAGYSQMSIDLYSVISPYL